MAADTNTLILRMASFRYTAVSQTGEAMLPKRIEIALADYDRRRDRDVPPVFVGRDDELRFLRDTVAAAQAGARGVTAIVQGVPGAGKSALCAQVERELQASAADEAPIAVISKECDFFNRTPVSMVKELAAEAPVRLDRLRRLPGFEKAEEHIGKALGVATALLRRGSSLDLAMQAMNLDESSSLGAALDAFRERMWPAGITLILAIDEAQGMEDTPQVRSNLRAIHGKRFATEVAILAFGLQGTAARLRELGLSRLASGQIRHLGHMPSADAACLVDRTLDHLGLAAEDEDWRQYAEECGFSARGWTVWRDAAKALILEESADFPHHLVNGVRGVCQVVLAGGLRHPGDRELGALRQACRSSKEEYYGARLEPFADHTAALAAALYTADEGGEVDRGVVLRALEACDNNGRPVDEDVALAVLKGLIEQGLLARRGMFRVAIEIPSLAGYLTAEFGASLAADTGAARRLAECLDIPVPRNPR